MSRKSFTYNQQQNEYILKLKKCRWCWLLLLLLLPLLLLIPFTKTVKIQVIDTHISAPAKDIPVHFHYVKREFFSFDKKRFFTRYQVPDSVDFVDTTDTAGIAEFQMRLTLYQWLFRKNDTARAYSLSRCYGADSLYKMFKLRKRKPAKLYLSPRLVDVTFTVVDVDDGNNPLPDALVEIRGDLYGYQDSGRTDLAGNITFHNVPLCSKIFVRASRFGWSSDSLERYVYQIPGRHDTLYLKEIGTVIKFYVANLYNKKPIPNAWGYLYFSTKPGVEQGRARTNIYGRAAIGTFEDVHIIKSIKIDVNKYHKLIFYNDSSTVKYYPVLQWKRFTKEQQTIYLRPNPHPLLFYDVDCNDGRGLANVRNVVIIRHPDGRVDSVEIFSNSDGAFTISAAIGDLVTIKAYPQYPCPNEYEKNDTAIVNVPFEKLKDDADLRKIALCKKPGFTLKFRDVDSQTWVGITGVINKIYIDGIYKGQVYSSTGGWFEVNNLYDCNLITIIADGTDVDYDINDTKIRNKSVLDLRNAPQIERDIPLNEEPPIPINPCNTQTKAGHQDTTSASYDVTSGFVVNWDMYNVPDRIIIICGAAKKSLIKRIIKGKTKRNVLYDSGLISGKGTYVDDGSCNSSTITVILVAPESGTDWNYEVTCQ